jgi:DNA-binding PadR family transcriptional regulator
LKKLVSEGLIKTSSKSKNSDTPQRVYEITPEGLECLKKVKDMLANAGRRWSSMRGIFVDLMDPAQIPAFLVDGARVNFQISQEIIDSKISKLSPSDAEYTLKEYALSLERQLNWTRAKLEELESRTGVEATPNMSTR